MSTPPTDPTALRQAVMTLDRHSALFRWLYARHDEIAEALGGQAIRWRSFCAWVAELGFVDANGRTPSERNARETWYQVRLAVARREAARRPGRAGGGKQMMPSRAPADWRPPLAVLPESSPPSDTEPLAADRLWIVAPNAATANLSPADKIARLHARLGRNRL